MANRVRSARPDASATRSRASSTAAWISMRLGAAALPPRTQPGPNTSPSTVTAVIPSRAREAAASTPSTRATRSSSRSTAGRSRSEQLDDVDAPTAPAGQRRPLGPVHHARRLGHEKTRAPRVVGAQPVDRRGRAGQRVDGERIAGPAQRGGDRDLVTRLDLQQRRDRARDRMRAVAGREQRGGAVLAAQAQLQGLHPGGGGLPVALGGPLLLAQLLELGFAAGRGGRRPARSPRRGPPRPPPRRRSTTPARRTRARPARRGTERPRRFAHPAELALGGLDPATPWPPPARPAGPGPRGGRRPRGRPARGAAAPTHTPARPRPGRPRRPRGRPWRRRSRRRAPRAARAGRPPGGAAPRGRGWTRRSLRRAPRPRGPRGAAGRAPTPATRSR